MGWEFIQKAPPWLVVLVLILMSGSGGAGVFSLVKPDPAIQQALGKLDNTLEKLIEKLSQQERKLDNIEWRTESHSDRLNGHATKNRDQDKNIHELDRKVTRIEAYGVTQGLP